MRNLLLASIVVSVFVGCNKDKIENVESSRKATCGMYWKDIIPTYGIKDTAGLDIHIISSIGNQKTILSGLKNEKFWVSICNDSMHYLAGEWVSEEKFEKQRSIEGVNEILTIPTINIKETINIENGVIFSIPINSPHESFHDICFIQGDEMNLVKNVKCHFIKKWYNNSVITGLDAEKDPTITTFYNGYVFYALGLKSYSVPFYFTMFLDKIDVINDFEGIINLGELVFDGNSCEIIPNNKMSAFNLKERIEKWKINLSDYIECDKFSLESTLNSIKDNVAKYNISLTGENVVKRTRGISINIETGEIKLDLIPIEKIELKSISINLAINETQQLEYNITPTDATELHEWKVSDPKIAIIEKDVVKAINEGSTIISLVSQSGEVEASCKVNVKYVNVESVRLNPSDLLLGVGEGLSVSACIIPENATNKAVNWHIEDNSVVEILEQNENQCQIKGLREGETTLVCTTADGDKIATCKIEVKPILIENINLTPAKIDAYKGMKFKFNVGIYPSNATNKDIEWSYDAYETSLSEPIIIHNGDVEVLDDCGMIYVTAKAKDGNASSRAIIEIKPINELIEVEAMVKELDLTAKPNIAKITSSILNPTSIPIEVMNVMLIEEPTRVQEIQSDLGVLNKEEKITNTFKNFQFENVSFDDIMKYLLKYFVRYQIRVNGEVFNIEKKVNVFGN